MHYQLPKGAFRERSPKGGYHCPEGNKASGPLWPEGPRRLLARRLLARRLLARRAEIVLLSLKAEPGGFQPGGFQPGGFQPGGKR
jgi:hypothetical protein